MTKKESSVSDEEPIRLLVAACATGDFKSNLPNDMPVLRQAYHDVLSCAGRSREAYVTAFEEHRKQPTFSRERYLQNLRHLST